MGDQDKAQDSGGGREGQPGRSKGQNSREARLKAALKANMGRRKAQARARNAQTTEEDAVTQAPKAAADPNEDS